MVKNEHFRKLLIQLLYSVEVIKIGFIEHFLKIEALLLERKAKFFCYAKYIIENDAFMAYKTILIQNAKIVRTGAGGGHSYLSGECEYEGKKTSVAALMVNKVEEAKLSEGDVIVKYSRHDYTQGAGLLLSECTI